jgi:hypothetical protein
VCGEIVPRNQHESHHGAHKRDRANHVAAGFAARKESSDMAKAKVVTPKEQGVPAEYLNEDGTKFTPGADATFKSDAFKTILYHEHGFTDIDLSTRRVDIALEDAKRIVSERGWNDLFIKSLKSAEAKVARALAKAADKKAKVKDEVAAKRKAKAKTEATEVAPVDETEAKPDPKPERKARSSRVRKVGS